MKKIFCCILLAALTFNVFGQTADTLAKQEKLSATDKVISWYNSHLNYGTVTLLMAVESSFIPFPSEVVIPPAVYVACDPQSASGMKIWIIVLFGTLGAMLGAFINYYLSRWLGRPIIYKFVDSKVGHMLLLSGEKMEKAEAYFNQHGNISTLIGRLIPVIRQLISIPAGLAKMNIGSFLFYTFLGAGIWNTILASLGAFFGKSIPEDVLIEQVQRYSGYVKVGLAAIIAIGFIYYVSLVVKANRATKKANP